MLEFLRTLENGSFVCPTKVAMMLGQQVSDVRRKIEEREQSGVTLRCQSIVHWNRYDEALFQASEYVLVSP